MDADTLRRAQTEALINMKPADVVLTRYTWLSDGAGGRTKGPATPLPAQRMRLVPSSTVLQEAPARVTSDGRTVTPNWLLIALPECDIHEFDTCVVLGHKLEIVYVSTSPTERRVAECWESK